MYLAVLLYIVNFLRTLVIIAAIYFAIRIFSRYILPLIVQKKVDNMQQKMQDKFREQQRGGRREGEVTIEQNPDKQKNNNSGQGEYVDFEEVE